MDWHKWHLSVLDWMWPKFSPIRIDEVKFQTFVYIFPEPGLFKSFILGLPTYLVQPSLSGCQINTL